jgi:aspartyl protease family protein
MGRAYLYFILIGGLFSAMISQCSSRHSASPDAAGTAFQAATSNMSSSDDEPNPGSSHVAEDGVVQLQRSSDGHFYADVQINGATIHALVDTGATEIALSRSDASSAGIATSIGMPEVVGQGADGEVHGEVVRIDRIGLGNKTAEDMPAVVLNAGGESLLGQRFLSKFDSVEIHGDTMELK